MLTLAAPHTIEEEVKKSRFIARATRADSREAAAAFVTQVREAKATHNCWAYRIGPDYRFSDDGEPGGTAGQPILRAIESQGLDHVVVVVTRYFGGIKLGAGGLARAYGGTAASCLRAAPRVEVRPQVRLRLEVAFADLGATYPHLNRKGLERLSEHHTPDGLVAEVAVDDDQETALAAALTEATAGRARITRVDE